MQSTSPVVRILFNRDVAYIPAAMALFTNYHCGPTRSLATGIHMPGFVLGSVIGGLGGWLALHHGWNYASTVIGLVYSTGAAALVGHWDVITGGAQLNFQWITSVALVTTVLGSNSFSLWPTRGKPAWVLAAYSGAALLWTMLFGLLRR